MRKEGKDAERKEVVIDRERDGGRIGKRKQALKGVRMTRWQDDTQRKGGTGSVTRQETKDEEMNKW